MSVTAGPWPGRISDGLEVGELADRAAVLGRVVGEDRRAARAMPGSAGRVAHVADHVAADRDPVGVAEEDHLAAGVAGGVDDAEAGDLVALVAAPGRPCGAGPPRAARTASVDGVARPPPGPAAGPPSRRRRRRGRRAAPRAPRRRPWRRPGGRDGRGSARASRARGPRARRRSGAGPSAGRRRSARPRRGRR